MNRIVLTLLLHFLFFSAVSQNSIYIDDEIYDATPTWNFSGSGKIKSIDLTVGRSEDTGCLLLSLKAPFGSSQILGTVFLFLENNEIIKCYDKGVKDRVDGKIMALYFFTNEEIKQLKINRISKIRYSISGESNNENFTASNIKPIEFSSKSYSLGYFETNKDIATLFNK